MDRPLPWWLRLYMVVGFLQASALGITGFISPTEIQIPLRMSALNVRFVAALYLTSGIAILLPVFARRVADARLFAVGFTFGIVVITVEIIVHWNDYMAAGLPHRFGFFGIYVLDVVLASYAIPAAGFLSLPRRGRHYLTTLFLAESAVLGVVGLGLLVVPYQMARIWPWSLPSVLSQLYAAFFLTLALAALLASQETSVTAVRMFSFVSVVFPVLVLLASLLHLPKFKSGPETVVWFVVLGIGAVVFTGAFVSTFTMHPALPPEQVATGD